MTDNDFPTTPDGLTPDGSAPDGLPLDDAEMQRLRSADPAAGLEPDLVALRAAVQSRIDADAAAETSPGEPGEGSGSVAPVVDIDQARSASASRRRRPGMLIAAVAAGAIVVGGGGFAIGANTGSDGGSKSAQSMAAADSSSERSSSVQAPEIAPGAMGDALSNASGAAAGAANSDARVGMMGAGHTSYTQQGLSDVGGTAEGWTFDAAGAFSQETALRLASAMKLSGAASSVDGDWVVGSTDWTGPSLRLSPDGQASFSYNDPSQDPYACAVPEPAAAPDDGGAASSDTSVADCKAGQGPAAPKGDAATTIARDTLTAMGFNTSAMTFEPSTEDSAVSWVSAYLLIDGKKSTVMWSVNLTSDGVYSVYGPAASVISLGEYPIISPVAAVARMSDPRFGVQGGFFPMPYAAKTEPAPPDGASAMPTVPGTPGPGQALSWPIDKVTLVESEIIASSYYQSDGSIILAPTYQLTDTTGNQWTVLAVADSALNFG